MKIQILSKRRKHRGIDEYTKKQDREVRSFVYDEDCFWFDFKGQRFGLSIPEIIKQREYGLKSLGEKDDNALIELIKESFRKKKK